MSESQHLDAPCLPVQCKTQRQPNGWCIFITWCGTGHGPWRSKIKLYPSQSSGPFNFLLKTSAISIIQCCPYNFDRLAPWTVDGIAVHPIFFFAAGFDVLRIDNHEAKYLVFPDTKSHKAHKQTDTSWKHYLFTNPSHLLQWMLTEIAHRVVWKREALASALLFLPGIPHLRGRRKKKQKWWNCP